MPAIRSSSSARDFELLTVLLCQRFPRQIDDAAGAWAARSTDSERAIATLRMALTRVQRS